MEKTISIKRAEFMRGITTVIGQAQLPACVVADCLHLISLDVEKLAQQQLQHEINEYRQAQQAEEMWQKKQADTSELKEVDGNVNGGLLQSDKLEERSE